MRSVGLQRACCCLWVLAWLRVCAQEPATGVVRGSGPAAGLNAGVTIAAAHDSAIGWYNVVVPVVSVAFAKRYAADVSLPVYPYRLSSGAMTPADGTNVPQGTGLRNPGAELGDMLVRLHGTFAMGLVESTSTVSMTLPTGNRADGLGTGRATFNFDNLFERSAGRTGFFTEIGAGDWSGLANRQVTEDDSSLGPQAQFETGVVLAMPLNMTLQSFAYEELPLGDQKRYTTIYRRGYPLLTVPSGRNVYEDNGFNTSLTVPVSGHVMLSGAYNRSLRLHLDTVSVGVTYVWRGMPLHPRGSAMDRAMREAELGNDVAYPAVR